MFRLGHLSDVHLAPLPWAEPALYLNKRAIGLLSWQLRRRRVHKPHILDLISKDVRAVAPDHLGVTGDLANIGLPEEFISAANWLKQLGPPDRVSVTPGNHDAYVGVNWDSGLGLWRDYMTGDMQVEGAHGDLFPFVRQRRHVALIGTTTAVPTALHRAQGSLGATQLERLAVILPKLRERGFFRILMIHHPPLPGLAVKRKALTDAGELQGLLEAEGCELVIHGHNHEHMRHTLETRFGPSHIIGVPSASAAAHREKPAAAWYVYTIARRTQRWMVSVEVRQYQQAVDKIVPETPFNLDYG